MNIITDTKSITGIGEVPQGSKILVLCHNDENFGTDAVRKLLDLKATLYTVPEDTSYAFALGMLAGTGKREDTVILTADDACRTTAKVFGYTTEISQAKPTRTRKPRTEKKMKDDNLSDIPVNVPAPGFMPAPEDDEPADSAKSSIHVPSGLLSRLRMYGIVGTDAEKVYLAIQNSTEYISYELQLRLCLMDENKAKLYYEKTKAAFKELKALCV